jgi:hypothetical protein
MHHLKYMSVKLSLIRISMLIFLQCSERISIAKTIHKIICVLHISKSRHFLLLPLFLLLVLLADSDNCASTICTSTHSQHGAPVKWSQ